MSCREQNCNCQKFTALDAQPTQCQCTHSCVRHKVSRVATDTSSTLFQRGNSERHILEHGVNSEGSIASRLSFRNSMGTVRGSMLANSPTLELEQWESEISLKKTSLPSYQLSSLPQPEHVNILPEDSGPTNFAESLPHAFDKVKDQLETGMAEVYRLKQFVMKLCQLQQDFGNEVANLVKSEKKKISAWRKPDFMVTCGGAVMDLFDRVEEMSQMHTWFASEARLSVVEPLQTFEEIAKPILNNILEKEKAITQSMDARRMLMEKKKLECVRLLNVYGHDLGFDDNETSSSDISAGKRPLSSRSGKLLYKIGSRAANVLGKQEEAKSKVAALVQKTCASYADEVSISNNLLHSCTSREVPDCLSEMQSLEEMRINSVRGHLEAFGNLFVPMSRRLQIISEQLSRSNLNIDVSKDIHGFCINTASQYASGSRRLELFEYELSIPLEKINRVIGVSVQQQDRFFKTSLCAIMDRQKEAGLFPNHKLPNIFTVLKAALIRSGGLFTEGIFRISPEASLVVDLAKQMDSGNLNISADLPVHVPAALLKKWMRELSTPIIPEDKFYMKCLNVGKQSTCPAPSELSALLEEMPHINASLFCSVVHTIRQFASNQDQNRMSAMNLCIVLVPSVLRCPENIGPSQMMKNSQYESKFLQYCVSALDLTGKWTYPQNEEDDALQFLSTPSTSSDNKSGHECSDNVNDEPWCVKNGSISDETQCQAQITSLLPSIHTQERKSIDNLST
uniref:Rho-GAP domain-containing protein n=1 Tax=Spongospora subterranea TaxID=70186 RepID=A0A0H5QJX1_9EUKA|eukprot:CRZ01937.1 hypothetical protein [Spongospora subterranea]